MTDLIVRGRLVHDQQVITVDGTRPQIPCRVYSTASNLTYDVVELLPHVHGESVFGLRLTPGMALPVSGEILRVFQEHRFEPTGPQTKRGTPYRCSKCGLEELVLRKSDLPTADCAADPPRCPECGSTVLVAIDGGVSRCTNCRREIYPS
jgi:DNA-directed RNA polymerase subunit RPC12/RpoP